MTKYYCPHCGTDKIYEYDESFDCMVCKTKSGLPLEFDKVDFDTLEDKANILSVQEKLAVIREFGLDKLSEKELKDLFKD